MKLPGAVIQSDGTVTLATQQAGSIDLTAAKVEGAVGVTAKAAEHLTIASQARTTQSGENISTQIDQATVGSSLGSVTLAAGGNAAFRAIKVFAGQDINIKVDGDLTDHTLGLMSQTVERYRGGMTRHTSTQQVPSQYVAGGSITSVADGVQTLVAPQFKIGTEQQLLIFGGRGVDVRETHNTTETVSTHTSKSRGLFGSSRSTTTSSSSSASSVRMKVEGGETVRIVSGGDLTLTAPVIEAPKTVLTAMEGAVHILQGTTYYTAAFQGQRANLFWQKVQQRSVQSQTYTPAEFGGKVEIESPEVMVQQVCGKALEFMNQLEIKSGNLTVNFVKELYDVKESTRQGPSVGLSALIALAAGIATYGTGAAAWAGGSLVSLTGASGATASIVSAMGAAGLSALSAQAAVSMVEAQGDLTEAARKLAKKETLKALVQAMVTAGVVAGVSQALGTAGSATEASARASAAASAEASAAGSTAPTLGQSVGASVVQQVQFQAVNALATVATGVALGQRIEDAVGGAVRGGAIAAVGAVAANQVAFAFDRGFVDRFGQVLLHAGVGAGVGGALGGTRSIGYRRHSRRSCRNHCTYC
jgi:filamentous hemagglutinin